jgi:hypothetical protein
LRVGGVVGMYRAAREMPGTATAISAVFARSVGGSEVPRDLGASDEEPCSGVASSLSKKVKDIKLSIPRTPTAE